MIKPDAADSIEGWGVSNSGQPPTAMKKAVGLAPLVWVLLGMCAVFLSMSQTQLAEAQLLMASFALAFGVWAFVGHGGHQVTAAGVYSLASAAFVGYAGLWWLGELGESLPYSMFVATSAGYFSHIVMYYLFWHADGYANRRPVIFAPASVAVWAINVGTIMAAGSFAIRRLGGAFATFADSGVYSGIILFSVGLAVRPTSQRLGFWRILGMSIGVFAYVELIFSGYGRLRVVSMGVAIAIIISSRLGGRALKYVMLLAIPIVVSVLSQIRQGAVVDRYGPSLRNAGGADSEVGPLMTFSRLLNSGGSFQSGDGSTFWATLVAFIPRRYWDGKPEGFGTVLTRILEPERLSAGHSMAALDLGEWFYNWGWAGIVAMVVGVGLLVKLLDQMLRHAFTSNLASAPAVVALTATVIAVSAIGDFVWVGTFTYGVRAGFRIAVLVLIAGTIAWTRPIKRRTSGTTRSAGFKVARLS